MGSSGNPADFPKLTDNAPLKVFNGYATDIFIEPVITLEFNFRQTKNSGFSRILEGRYEAEFLQLP